MAGTGVLPFIRGIDLTLNNLEDDRFPEAMEDMTGLRWLKLTDTHITSLPRELEKLQKLEHLTVKRNQVGSLDIDFCKLPCLRSLNVSRNALTTQSVPAELFSNEELNTLDLSHNSLTEVPEGLLKAKSLLVLNLSHNKLEVVPSQLMMAATDLLHLDVSHNDLDALPPQLRRLSNLQVLVLSHNPLSHFQARSYYHSDFSISPSQFFMKTLYNLQIRPLPSLTELRTLQMRNTQRTNSNIPTALEGLVHLSDVDFSENDLTKIPEGLLTLPNLKRLNLGSNHIVEVSPGIEGWAQLETFILSRNQVKAMPSSLCKLTKVRKLYLNENQLDFEGIPSGMGKLSALEIFSAADNLLEMIPEGLCRCGSLKKLILARNKLITLPDAIHLTELEVLDLKGNPELVMPPKPVEMAKGSGVEFYNVDFSLQHQLRLAGASVPKAIAEQQVQKDPVARKMRLRRRHRDTAGSPDEDQAKVLKGMKEVAKSKDKRRKEQDAIAEAEASSIKAKRWDEALEKPPLDYSEFFDEDVGQFPGLTIWEIENFYPNQLEESAHGHFYEGDCYIVLNTLVEESGSLNWQIFYWQGDKATIDKRTCSAMHSVNLRNYLGASCRNVREEQGDESEDFLKLFGGSISCIEGARTASGFYTVEEVEYATRMYRIHESGPATPGHVAGSTGHGGSIHLEPVTTAAASLDPRYVFLVDAGLNIFVWYGLKCKNTLKSKARLMSEKINKIERKGKASIHIFSQGEETSEFWQTLADNGGGGDAGDDSVPTSPPKAHVPDDFKPVVPRLYIVGLGMGYLELPQVTKYDCRSSVNKFLTVFLRLPPPIFLG